MVVVRSLSEAEISNRATVVWNLVRHLESVRLAELVRWGDEEWSRVGGQCVRAGYSPSETTRGQVVGVFMERARSG